MIPLDRRTYVSAVAAFGTGSLTGCSTIQRRTSGDSSPTRSKTNGEGYTTISSVPTGLPIVLEATFPDPAIQEMDNLVVIDAYLKDSSLLDIDSSYLNLEKDEIHGPDIFIEIGNGTITHILPGNFPRQARILNDEKRAYGQGINAPWGAEKHAVFSYTVSPDSDVQSVPVRITIGGRSTETGDFKEVSTNFAIPTRARRAGTINVERFARAAEERARLCQQFGAFLVDIESFDNRAGDALRESIFSIGIGGTQMLADEVLGSIIGVSDVADYIWSAYTIHYKSPFDYVLGDGVPENPADVEGTELAEYGPPFFSALLSNAQGLIDDFNTLVENFDATAREAEGAAAILFHTVAEAADSEANAWRSGDEARARQLLANQLYMVTGEDQQADRERIETLFNKYDADIDGIPGEDSVTDFVYFRKDAYPDASRNLIQKLFEVRGLRQSDPRYARILSTVHAMRGVMRGEGNRIKDLLRISRNRRGTPTETNQSPVAEAGNSQTVTVGDTVTLDGRGSSDPEGDSLTYQWTQISGPSMSLEHSDTPTPKFTAPNVDDHTTVRFELTVSDGKRSDTDTVTVTIGNTSFDMVDGFEDANLVEYSGQIEGYRVQRSTVKNGDWALEGQVQSGENQRIYRGVSVSQPSRVQGYVQVGTGGGNENAQMFYRSGGPDGASPIHINFSMNHGNSRFGDTSGEPKLLVNATEVMDIEYNEWYFVEVAGIDWNREMAEKVIINGTIQAEDISFEESASSIDTLSLPVNDWGDETAWFDDVTI